MALRMPSKNTMGFEKKPLAIYRCHPKSITGSMNLKYSLESKLSVVEQAIERDYSDLIYLRRKALSNVYSGITDYMLVRGSDSSETRKLLRIAISLYPITPFNYLKYILTFFPRSIVEKLRVYNRSLRKLSFLISGKYRVANYYCKKN